MNNYQHLESLGSRMPEFNNEIRRITEKVNLSNPEENLKRLIAISKEISEKAKKAQRKKAINSHRLEIGRLIVAVSGGSQKLAPKPVFRRSSAMRPRHKIDNSVLKGFSDVKFQKDRNDNPYISIITMDNQRIFMFPDNLKGISIQELKNQSDNGLIPDLLAFFQETASSPARIVKSSDKKYPDKCAISLDVQKMEKFFQNAEKKAEQTKKYAEEELAIGKMDQAEIAQGNLPSRINDAYFIRSRQKKLRIEFFESIPHSTAVSFSKNILGIGIEQLEQEFEKIRAKNPKLNLVEFIRGVGKAISSRQYELGNPHYIIEIDSEKINNF